MIGVDLTRKSRFANVSDTFIAKMLHPDELVEYEVSNDKLNFLASHWAIKEALYKSDAKFFVFNKIRLKKINGIYTYPGYIITTSSEADYYIAFVLKKGE